MTPTRIGKAKSALEAAERWAKVPKVTRREFPKSVRVAVIKRATVNGVVICEKCGAIAKKFQIDHVRADGLLGEPVLGNAMLICEPCYAEKNPADAKAIAQAKRREAKHIGAKPAPTRPIQSAPFQKAEKDRPKGGKADLSHLGESAIARRFR